jgi:hypothetical protein
MLAKFFDKPFKIVFFTLGLVLVLVLAAVLISNLLVAAEMQKQAAVLFGTYKVEKIIYSDPLAQYAADSPQLQSLSLDARTLSLLFDDKSQKTVSINYDKTVLSEDDFTGIFSLEYNRPDITYYKNRTQWILNKASRQQSGFRVYQLDGELWLAELVLLPRHAIYEEVVSLIFKLSPAAG